jgi:hypothetical protein
MTRANRELTLDHLDEVSGGTNPYSHPHTGPVTPWEARRDMIRKLDAVENTTVIEARTTFPFQF